MSIHEIPVRDTPSTVSKTKARWIFLEKQKKVQTKNYKATFIAVTPRMIHELGLKKVLEVEISSEIT